MIGLLSFCVSIFLFIKWGVLLVCALWLAFIPKLVNISVNFFSVLPDLG